jgi:5-methylcytosine-specific restriction protein A
MAERLRGRAAVAQRIRRLRRTKGLCELCLAKGRIEVATEVDHIKPLAKGGDDTDENTQNLCRDCHAEKTARDFGHKAKMRIGPSGWPE